jgi:hypothetical protein
MNASDYIDQNLGTSTTPPAAALDYINQQLEPAAQPQAADAPQMSRPENFGNAFMKGYGQLGLGILGVGPQLAAALGLEQPDQAASDEKVLDTGVGALDKEYPTQPGIEGDVGSALGQVAPAMLVPGVGTSGAVAGLASSLANAAPSTPALEKGVNAAVQVPLGVLVNKGTNAVAQGLGTLASKGLNAAAGITSPLADAYEEAGVTPRLTGDISESPFLQQIQATASKLPLGSGQIAQAGQKTLDEFGKSVDDTASQLGKSATYQDAGTFLQKSGKDWLEDFNGTNNKLWGSIDKDLGNATGNPDLNVAIPANNTADVIASIRANAGGNKSAEGFLTSGLAKSLDNVIKESGGEPLGSGLPSSIQPNEKPLQWKTISALRTRVGEYLQNPSMISDAGHAQAKMLYGALTKDMQDGIAATGDTDLLNKFQSANYYTSAGHNFIENVLQPAMKSDPEKAASNLLAGGKFGGTGLEQLREQIPQAADELAAVSLRRGGAGASDGAAGNSLSPSTWLTNRDPIRKMSPEANQALFPDPKVRSKLGALDKVASSMRATDKFVNHSGSGGHLATMSAFSAPAIGALEGMSHGGPTGALVGGLAGSVPLGVGGLGGLISTQPSLAKFLSTPGTHEPFGVVPSRVSPVVTNYLSRFLTMSPGPSASGGP